MASNVSRALPIACFILLTAMEASFTSQAQELPGNQLVFVNSELPDHPAVLDASRRLLPWYRPGTNLAYDHFIRMDWDFLEHKVPLDKVDGVKVYLVQPVYRKDTLQGKETMWQHNPPSLFAHQMDMFVRYYAYSGDVESLRVMREMLDYQMAHGTSPADWEWASVPFPTSCIGDKDYGHCLQSTPRSFYGGIETDKIGELGLSYVQMFETTGERKYLDAGTACANALARHVRPGDTTHTPWAFRIDAHTGEVIQNEEYGGAVIAPVRLFEELIKIKEGNTAAYQRARDIAWRWILQNPLDKKSAAWDKWSGYYEDQPRDNENVNDMDSMLVAFYILSKEDPSTVDPAWRVHVRHLIDRSRLLLGRGPFFGAWGIDEQLRTDDLPPGGEQTSLRKSTGVLLGTDNRGCCTSIGIVCRTANWAAINAMFHEKTGDGQALEDAYRSLNYATYFQLDNGEISCCGLSFDEYWFEDGHADAGRGFMWALGAVSSFAPAGEDHLLRSSSTIRNIQYNSRDIQYETFDSMGTEKFRLSFKPKAVSADNLQLQLREELSPNEAGYSLKSYPGGDYELVLRRIAGSHVHVIG